VEAMSVSNRNKELGLKGRADSSGRDRTYYRVRASTGSALCTRQQPAALWILIAAVGFITIASFYLLWHKVSGDYGPYRIFSAGIAAAGEIPGATSRGCSGVAQIQIFQGGL